MTIKEFIEKAIEGGWTPEKEICCKDCKLTVEKFDFWVETYDALQFNGDIFALVLDSKSWKAVSKVEGWNDEPKLSLARKIGWNSTPRAFMHKMIDHLIDGGTIESYLETL